ncbi:hypothetical protein ACXX82_24090 [Glaciimonas sp. GNP009]
MSEPILPMPEQEAFHKAFSWLPVDHQTDKHTQFRALAVDVCRGIQTCLEVTHFRTLNRSSDAMPTLSTIHTERLMRLASSSSQMLAEIAARHFDDLNDKSGKASNKI